MSVVVCPPSGASIEASETACSCCGRRCRGKKSRGHASAPGYRAPCPAAEPRPSPGYVESRLTWRRAPVAWRSALA